MGWSSTDTGESSSSSQDPSSLPALRTLGFTPITEIFPGKRRDFFGKESVVQVENEALIGGTTVEQSTEKLRGLKDLTDRDKLTVSDIFESKNLLQRN